MYRPSSFVYVFRVRRQAREARREQRRERIMSLPQLGALHGLRCAPPCDQSVVDKHELKLVTEFGGEERRFCYVTGGPQECFQVSIEPPHESETLVNA